MPNWKLLPIGQWYAHPVPKCDIHEPHRWFGMLRLPGRILLHKQGSGWHLPSRFLLPSGNRIWIYPLPNRYVFSVFFRYFIINFIKLEIVLNWYFWRTLLLHLSLYPDSSSSCDSTPGGRAVIWSSHCRVTVINFPSNTTKLIFFSFLLILSLTLEFM